MIFNEIDYDQPSTDMDSFIEIYNPTANPVALNDLTVARVTGGTNLEDDRYATDRRKRIAALGWLSRDPEFHGDRPERSPDDRRQR